jgi:hypothetical protein
MGNFSDKLKGMQSTWADSSNVYDSTFGGVKVDAGQYVARLQGAKLVESKTSGNLMIRREHVILEGQFQGMIVYDNMNLANAMGMSFVRRWIDQLGYESPAPDKPEELEDIIAAIVKEAATVKIAIKHSGDFTNVSIIEVLPSEDAPEPDAKPEPAKEPPKTKANANANTSSKASAKPAEKTDEEKLAERLFSFCKAQDIATEMDDTVDVLKERIAEFSYPEADLTDEEKELFAEVGLTDSIEVPAPEPVKKPVSKKKK